MRKPADAFRRGAPGYRPFNTRVTVESGGGATKVALLPVRGSVEVKARAGTMVTAIDAVGRPVRGQALGFWG